MRFDKVIKGGNVVTPAGPFTGDVGIRGEQGVGGPPHRPLHHLGEGDEVLQDGVELVGIGVAHGTTVAAPGSRPRSCR